MTRVQLGDPKPGLIPANFPDPQSEYRVVMRNTISRIDSVRGKAYPDTRFSDAKPTRFLHPSHIPILFRTLARRIRTIIPGSTGAIESLDCPRRRCFL